MEYLSFVVLSTWTAVEIDNSLLLPSSASVGSAAQLAFLLWVIYGDFALQIKWPVPNMTG